MRRPLLAILFAAYVLLGLEAGDAAPSSGGPAAPHNAPELRLRLPRASPGDGPVSLLAHDREVNITAISDEPPIFHIAGLFSKEERKKVVKLALREPQFDSFMASGSAQSWRRSTQAWVRKDPVGARGPMAALVRRVAAVLGVSAAALEAGHPAQVLRYEKGGRYFPHFDSRHLNELGPYPEETDYRSYVVSGGYPYAARVATVFCVLKEAPAGGNTSFPLAVKEAKEYPSRNMVEGMSSRNPKAEAVWERTLPRQCDGSAVDGGSVAVAPGPGSCVLFYNHHLVPDARGVGEALGIGELDRRSMHAGCPVTKGTKWGMNWWLEAQPPFVRVQGKSEL